MIKELNKKNVNTDLFNKNYYLVIDTDIILNFEDLNKELSIIVRNYDIYEGETTYYDTRKGITLKEIRNILDEETLLVDKNDYKKLEESMREKFYNECKEAADRDLKVELENLKREVSKYKNWRADDLKVIQEVYNENVTLRAAFKTLGGEIKNVNDNEKC